MDIKFNNTKEEYLYYEELVSLYPERIYVSYYTKYNKNNKSENNKFKYKFLDYSTCTNFYVKQNTYNTEPIHDIICADNLSGSSEDKYIKRTKKKTNINKIKIMTLSSLFVVSAILTNNYLLDK